MKRQLSSDLLLSFELTIVANCEKNNINKIFFDKLTWNLISFRLFNFLFNMLFVGKIFASTQQKVSETF